MKGFTLLELAIVLIVLAILSRAVMLRTSATAAWRVSTNADQLRQDISHMQMLAMTWGVPLRLTVASDSKSYTVTCRATTPSLPINTGCQTLDATPIDPATGKNFTTLLNDKDDGTIYALALVNNKVVRQVGNVLDVDSMGRPVNKSILISTNTLIPVDPSLPSNPAARLVVTSPDGSLSAVVTVYPITGLAVVN